MMRIVNQKITTDIRILELLKENPRKQFTHKEIVNVLKIHDNTAQIHIRGLRKENQIITKRVGNCHLIRLNDSSQTPIIHELEKPKPLKISKKVKTPKITIASLSKKKVRKDKQNYSIIRNDFVCKNPNCNKPILKNRGRKSFCSRSCAFESRKIEPIAILGE